MPDNKTRRVFIIDDALWEKFNAIADEQHRTASNMLVVLVDKFVTSQGSANGQVEEQGSARTA